jgi:hypothetical protein
MNKLYTEWISYRIRFNWKVIYGGNKLPLSGGGGGDWRLSTGCSCGAIRKNSFWRIFNILEPSTSDKRRCISAYQNPTACHLGAIDSDLIGSLKCYLETKIDTSRSCFQITLWRYAKLLMNLSVTWTMPHRLNDPVRILFWIVVWLLAAIP